MGKTTKTGKNPRAVRTFPAFLPGADTFLPGADTFLPGAARQEICRKFQSEMKVPILLIALIALISELNAPAVLGGGGYSVCFRLDL